MFDLIIFDCDGTLVDTEYLNNFATCELLAEQGLQEYDMDYAFRHFVGVKFNKILENITAETGHQFPDDMSQRYVARVKELAPAHFTTIDGAADLIEAAQNMAKTCVASNGQRGNVILALEMGGLKTYFPDERVFTALEVEHPKPAPDLFLHAAAKMEADPSCTLVLEDSVSGVRAGVAAGMTVWGFTGAHHDPEEHGARLAENGAHQVFNRLIHTREQLIGEKDLLSA